MSVRVRPYRPGDAPAMAGLFHAAVHALAARDYTPEQMRAWSPAPGDPARWAEVAADGRVTLIAVDADDRPVAYADLEPDGHVDHLYRHPDHPGAAAPLLAAVEDVARSRGLTRLRTEASEPARRFLTGHGFIEEGRRDFNYGGVAMHNYAMSKVVQPA